MIFWQPGVFASFSPWILDMGGGVIIWEGGGGEGSE